MIDPRIFRAYDIRGKARTQLSLDACRLIGQGFGAVLRRMYGKDNPEVVVGRDARTHGPELEAAVIEGLMSAGCHVLAIGPAPSPVNYFTICHADMTLSEHSGDINGERGESKGNRKADGGIQVTASHNPKEDNGLKLQIRDAEAFSGEDLQLLRKQIEADDFMSGTGSQSEIDAAAPYVEFLVKRFKNSGKGMEIVVDAGNGIAGPVYCEVFRAVGAKVIELYTEPDGNFPNHPADPSVHETLKDLQEKTKTSGADLGFAFDGDGDRLGIVDETGAIRTADETILLLAKDHLTRNPGKPVVFTVSNSGILETEIRKCGGRPVMCKVGHSCVERAMREHGSLLGGEQSGHFFCAEDYYCFDDALVASLRILSILTSVPNPPKVPSNAERPKVPSNAERPKAPSNAERPKVPSNAERPKAPSARPDGPVGREAEGPQVPSAAEGLSSLFNKFPKVCHAPELRPFCPDDAKGAVIAAITEHFKKSYPVITLDGVRIDFGDGAWAGIRQGNTSPCISICMEARTTGKLKMVQEIVMQHLKTYPEIQL